MKPSFILFLSFALLSSTLASEDAQGHVCLCNEKEVCGLDVETCECDCESANFICAPRDVADDTSADNGNVCFCDKEHCEGEDFCECDCSVAKLTCRPRDDDIIESDEENSGEEGSNEEGSNEEGSNEEGSNEEGSNEEDNNEEDSNEEDGGKSKEKEVEEPRHHKPPISIKCICEGEDNCKEGQHNCECHCSAHGAATICRARKSDEGEPRHGAKCYCDYNCDEGTQFCECPCQVSQYNCHKRRPHAKDIGKGNGKDVKKDVANDGTE